MRVCAAKRLKCRQRLPDMPWLERLTFGVNSAVLAQYRKLGRDGFLDAQLRATDEQLPQAVAQEIAQLPIAQVDARRLVLGIAAEQKRINVLPDGPRETGRAPGAQ